MNPSHSSRSPSASRRSPWAASASSIPDSTDVAGVHERLGIGDPCVPAIENDPTFASFPRISGRHRGPEPHLHLGRVPREPLSWPGLVPYGDLASGGCQTPRVRRCALPAPMASRLSVPTGGPPTRVLLLPVRERRGPNGRRGSYCPCGAGFTCKDLVAFVPGEEKLSGSYCVKDSVPVTAGASCTRSCRPSSATPASDRARALARLRGLVEAPFA